MVGVGPHQTCDSISRTDQLTDVDRLLEHLRVERRAKRRAGQVESSLFERALGRFESELAGFEMGLALRESLLSFVGLRIPEGFPLSLRDFSASPFDRQIEPCSIDLGPEALHRELVVPRVDFEDWLAFFEAAAYHQLRALPDDPTAQLRLQDDLLGRDNRAFCVKLDLVPRAVDLDHLHQGPLEWSFLARRFGLGCDQCRRGPGGHEQDTDREGPRQDGFLSWRHCSDSLNSSGQLPPRAR